MIVKDNGQSHFYIEHAGPGSPGGYDPKEPKDKDNEHKSSKTNIATINENKIHHITEGSRGTKHKWELLVPDKNWTDIKKIIEDVMETGEEKPYKSEGCSRAKEIQGHIVEVTYKTMEDGLCKISNAWVK